eukprot:gnl/Hemi2/16278_TR5413_c0_g1_i1.p1 gnl/Hemi2/16278_TR5413_c0_g1~~gnl/Hemi2/16278_TR5413_c0_g1_i1.p1  ORF type:complete len:122 (+),score=26.63 gnl/Hemi2/16278_TR5413_c0_g1_i1:74-439(+)
MQPVSYDYSSPDKDGFLTKQSMYLKQWRRRRFILKGNQLFVFKPTARVSNTQPPHDVIDLSQARGVKGAEEKCSKANSFQLTTPQATYYMYADSEQEKQEWISALGRVIVHNSRMFIPDEH